jgi:thiol-disulfide isomerase/thioredoxin/tetratricopeptide (TPR) repeat protein
MLKICLLLILVVSLVVESFAQSGVSDAGNSTSKVSESARRAVESGAELAARENYAAALKTFKKAISSVPGYLTAHIEYIQTKAYLMEQYDEAKSEYERLMAKSPDNPVYPAALAVGLFSERRKTKREWFERVVKLAPESAWGHLAKSQLIKEKEPAAAAAELLKAVEKDSDAPQLYFTELIFIQEFALKNVDDTLVTAEKMASRPELRAAALSNVWRLRLAKAKQSEEAKTKLGDELSQLAATKDIKLLNAIRLAYSDLLKDEKNAALTEEKIKRIDPTWFAERGVMRASMTLSDEGPRSEVLTGRQLSINLELKKIDFALSPEIQIPQIEKLLALKPNNLLKRDIYSRLMFLAQKAGDTAKLLKYGDLLLAIYPKNVTALSRIALAMADGKQDLAKAMRYALLARQLTEEFQPLKDLSDIEGNKFLEDYYSEAHQRQRYNSKRALALEAYAWTLCQMGKCLEAEPFMKQAVALARSEKNLSRHAEILHRLGRDEEAARVKIEAQNEYAAAIKRSFINQPTKDFELTTLEGVKVKLSDLKGKTVMVNFWATWCVPCVKEMPLFVEMYEKYKNRGFEILAITVDVPEDREKVVSFAKNFKLNFPVLFQENTAKLYGVNSFPTTVFIDRNGSLRYRSSGFNPENARRDLDIIIEEMLKAN